MGRITVDNGRRRSVSFGPYSGQAGVVDVGGETLVSFPGDARRLQGAEQGTIDGAAYRVRKAARSESVRGMVVLTVERIGGPV